MRRSELIFGYLRGFTLKIIIIMVKSIFNIILSVHQCSYIKQIRIWSNFVAIVIILNCLIDTFRYQTLI